ncbi:MAG: hypothetical protein IBX64_07900 [Actinobacteria bacterium]|nr:hypothetical protein [Actinomycetota bacterium]
MQQGKFYDPKAETSRRAVAIPDTLVQELKIHQAMQVLLLQENKYDLVFTNTKGKPIDGQNLTNRVIDPA